MGEVVQVARASVKPRGLRSDGLLMRLSVAKRRGLRRGVRELLVRLGAATGLAVGLLVALERPQPAVSAACKQPAEQSIGVCVNETVLATALPYVIAMGLGLVVRALVGLLIGQLLLGRGRPDRRAQPAAGRAVPAAMPGGRWITARYAGVCHSCGAPIAVGDHVLHRPRRTSCAACG